VVGEPDLPQGDLPRDGLLERRDDGGFYPVQPDLTQLRDLYELRVALETHGILRARDSRVAHDVALVRPIQDEPFVLVVCTTLGVSEDTANELIAEVSRRIWEERVA